MLKYLKKLIDNKDQASSKRFLGLIMSGFLIVAYIVILFTPKEIANTELLHDVLLYAFLIVLMSLFGLAVESVGFIMLQKAKTQAAAKILTPPTTVNSVDTVEGDITGQKSVTDKTTAIGDNIFDDNTEDMLKIKKSLTNSLKEE